MIEFKYTQDKSNPFDKIHEIRFMSDAEDLLDILEHFNQFIKSVGYLPKGVLQYVEEEEL